MKKFLLFFSFLSLSAADDDNCSIVEKVEAKVIALFCKAGCIHKLQNESLRSFVQKPVSDFLYSYYEKKLKSQLGLHNSIELDVVSSSIDVAVENDSYGLLVSRLSIFVNYMRPGVSERLERAGFDLFYIYLPDLIKDFSAEDLERLIKFEEEH